MNLYKVKDLLDNKKIPFGIVGNITIMNPLEKDERSYHEYKSIKEAAQDYGEWQLLQIFGGSNWSITLIVFQIDEQK